MFFFKVSLHSVCIRFPPMGETRNRHDVFSPWRRMAPSTSRNGATMNAMDQGAPLWGHHWCFQSGLVSCMESLLGKTYLDLPKGAEWMIRGAYTPSPRVQTAPFGRCWYIFRYNMLVFCFVEFQNSVHVNTGKSFKRVKYLYMYPSTPPNTEPLGYIYIYWVT